MYKIIGADEKEYGPVTANQIKQWLAEGRVNGKTRVRLEGVGDWKPLAEFPEFASALPIESPPPVSALPPSLNNATDLVKGPAIALIVTASLGILYYLFSGVATLAGGAIFKHELPATIPPELRAFFEGMQGPLAGCINLGVAALNMFVLLGAIKMMRLQSYGLAIAACIVAMLPCQCCCVLGLPFGIWALVTMLKPEVKSQFT